MKQSWYHFYNTFGTDEINFFGKFLKAFPEYDTKEFHEFACRHNKGDRDMGELQNIARHEVLRLAYEFSERAARFKRNLDGTEVS